MHKFCVPPGSSKACFRHEVRGRGFLSVHPGELPTGDVNMQSEGAVKNWTLNQGIFSIFHFSLANLSGDPFNLRMNHASQILSLGRSQSESAKGGIFYSFRCLFLMLLIIKIDLDYFFSAALLLGIDVR